jgi:heme O synthase-like polyprenyltransferase
MLPDVKGADRTLFESKIYCVLLVSLAVIPIIWNDYGLGISASILTAGLGIWYASTVWRINPTEDIDEKGRLPSAFSSFMNSLKYLALMFFGLVIVCMLPF